MDLVTLNNLPEGTIIRDSRFYDDEHYIKLPNDYFRWYTDAYDGVVLPEVTVKPQDWQLDFINNFGNKEIRNAFYDKFNSKFFYDNDDSPVHYLDPFSPILYAPGWDALNPNYGDVRNATLEHDTHERYENARNINNLVKRVYDLWNIGGRPKIQLIKDNGIIDRTLNWLGDKIMKLRGSEYGMGTSDNPRPYMIPQFNIMYLGNDIVGDFISELSHPIQRKFGTQHDSPSIFSDYELGYTDPRYYEYETHEVFEPMVRDYIQNNIIPNFLKDYLQKYNYGTVE